ncbi:MAG: 4Fe-4S binding protein [Candidatus Bipolaricaulota bacterium]|nr:MAG: 4Fe-4S binding protein [Candidatus Bipolaricaulota bacterium]
MTQRKVITIDEEKCTGCGICIVACAEGALEIVDGVARLVGDVYCDGLGDCLGECPEGALTLEVREAEAFDEAAVNARLLRMSGEEPLPCGCPGAALRTMNDGADCECSSESPPIGRSALTHWPVQLRLVPPRAPFLSGADLLICADCVPFAMPDLHARYLSGRAVLVGCPKFDDIAHVRDKLRATFTEAKPRSVTVLRMEVPCCSGLAALVEEAYAAAGATCPLETKVVAIEGGGVIA